MLVVDAQARVLSDDSQKQPEFVVAIPSDRHIESGLIVEEVYGSQYAEYIERRVVVWMLLQEGEGARQSLLMATRDLKQPFT